MRDFVDWLHEYNKPLKFSRRSGFYGLDLYSLYNSARAVISYLEDVDPDLAEIARWRYGCLSPWEADPAAYGHADGARFLDASQNAMLVANAERYYRIMYYGSRASWNLRDTHMFNTLNRVLEAHGSESKAVVWAHNSHIGDASATEMSTRGEHNIGQLCREAFGDQSYRIGFGTDHGTVAAASNWDAPMEVRQVRPSHAQSYERLFHLTGQPGLILPLRHNQNLEVIGELAQVAHASFATVVPAGTPKRLLWKMSIDLSYPLVPSTGLHDPLDAYITYNELAFHSDIRERDISPPGLKAEIAEAAAMMTGQRWHTDDPLGLGGLLFDTCRVFQLTAAAYLKNSNIVAALIDAATQSLDSFAAHARLSDASEYRLAFRELGFAIGLRAVPKLHSILAGHRGSFADGLQQDIDHLARFTPLGKAIEHFWSQKNNQGVRTWLDHLDINRVMLATSLLPEYAADDSALEYLAEKSAAAELVNPGE